MNEWITSDWFQQWLELTHDKIKQENIGYWRAITDVSGSVHWLWIKN